MGGSMPPVCVQIKLCVNLLTACNFFWYWGKASQFFNSIKLVIYTVLLNSVALSRKKWTVTKWFKKLYRFYQHREEVLILERDFITKLEWMNYHYPAVSCYDPCFGPVCQWLGRPFSAMVNHFPWLGPLHLCRFVTAFSSGVGRLLGCRIYWSSECGQLWSGAALCFHYL